MGAGHGADDVHAGVLRAVRSAARQPAVELRGVGQARPSRRPGPGDRRPGGRRGRRPALRHGVSRRLGRRHDPLDRGAGTDAAHDTGPADENDRRQLRRHQAARGGAAAPPARPAGDRRAARRRRGPRGEQSDDGGLGRGGVHPQARRPARPGAAGCRLHPAGRRANGGDHPAAAGVQPPPGAAAASAGPQRGHPRLRGDHPAHRGRGHRARARARGRGRAGAHRRRPVPAGAAQPGAQRARCHADRREADGGDP